MALTTILLVLTLIIFMPLYLFSPSEQQKRVKRMLEGMPMLPAYPVLGSIYHIAFLREKDKEERVANILRTYGPLFYWWLGSSPYVNLSSPELIEVVLRSTEIIDKAAFYKLLHPWMGTGLLTSTGFKWHTHRKIITPSFHFKILENFIDVFSQNAEILVEKLQREVGENGFYLRPYVSSCALDIICETAMGISVHAQDDTSSEYVAAYKKLVQIVSDRILQPLLHPDFIFKLTPMSKTHDKSLKILQNFVNEVIKERKEKRKNTDNSEVFADDTLIGRKKHVAFLDMLLGASEDGNKLNDDEIREEVHTFMFEGHDTVTAAMTWTLFELGQHPHIQEEVYKELEEIFQDSNRAPTISDLERMNYLERVIKETLRLHPSVIYISRLAHKDFQLGEYTIPAGTNVDFSLWCIHKNEKYFPNPEVFNPDHFLPERIVNRHPYAYIPFSAGPRNCIGQRFAILEEKTVLSHILRHYEIRSLDKREDVKMRLFMINSPVKELKFKLTKRK